MDRNTQGVRWWLTLDEPRRRLVSFQLVESLNSVRPLLARAQLHLFEAREHADELRRRPFVNVVEQRDGSPRINHLRRERPVDHVAAELLDLHYTGAVHAMFTALEVVGAVVVGVAGLPLHVLERSSYGGALGMMRAPPRETLPGVRAAWLELAECMDAVERESGPTNWRRWLIGIRHSVAHRARLPNLELISPIGPPEVGPDGLLVHQVDLERRLPRDPTRAYLQALEADPHATHLDEPAASTMALALRTLAQFIEGVAGPLLGLWTARRDCQIQIAQPESQWPDVDEPEGAPFAGFAPGPRLEGEAVMSVSHSALGQLDRAGVGERR